MTTTARENMIALARELADKNKTVTVEELRDVLMTLIIYTLESEAEMAKRVGLASLGLGL